MGDEDTDSNRVANGRHTVHRGHSTDVVTDKALAYLKEIRPADKPFALFCHFKALDGLTSQFYCVRR